LYCFLVFQGPPHHAEGLVDPKVLAKKHRN
jgi:hypothetical protein